MTSRQDLPRRPRAASGDLAAIAAEFRSQGVGPLMLAKVEQIAYQLAPRYNAAVYSEIGNWRHGLDDLVQDVVAESLLADEQARYLVDTSRTIDDFRRLLTRQVRRRLARRRTRTVIDNLLDRARPMLEERPFRRETRHQYVTYAPWDEPREERAATFRELRLAADTIRSIRQVSTSGRDRAPVVYSTPDLHRVLVRIAESLPNAFTIGELDRILRLTLPHLLPGFLDLDRTLMTDRPLVDGGADWSTMASAREAASSIRHSLDEEQLLIVAAKLAGLPDAEIASRLDISRRTAAYRKAIVFAILAEQLDHLTDEARLECLDRLVPTLQAALLQS